MGTFTQSRQFMFFVSTDELYLQLIYNVWRPEKICPIGIASKKKKDE